MSVAPKSEHRRVDETTRTLAVLLALTLASFLLMEMSGGLTTAPVIIVVTFVKVAVVGTRFMELRAAPIALIAAFGTWTIGTGTLLAILLHV